MSALLKPYVFGLTVAASLGFLCLPARADNVSVVEQEANQSTAIVGNGNISATSNQQIGNIWQKGNGSGLINNAATIRQRINQETGISGDGNTAATQNEQTANVTQINNRAVNWRKLPKFPFRQGR